MKGRRSPDPMYAWSFEPAIADDVPDIASHFDKFYSTIVDAEGALKARRLDLVALGVTKALLRDRTGVVKVIHLAAQD